MSVHGIYRLKAVITQQERLQTVSPTSLSLFLWILINNQRTEVLYVKQQQRNRAEQKACLEGKAAGAGDAAACTALCW